MQAMAVFRAAHAAGGDWRALVAQISERLEGTAHGDNIGLLYATDYLARHLGEILTELRQSTGIADWVGTVGIGIGAKLADGAAVGHFDRPALVAMVGRLPPDSFRVFEPVHGAFGAFRRQYGDWLARAHPLLGIVHGDPRNPLTPSIVADLAEVTGSFLVGGMTSSRAGRFPQVAQRVVEGGFSGVLFGTGVGAATGFAQSCAPIGPARRITGVARNLVMEVDGRPALAVLKEELAPHSEVNLDRIGGDCCVGLEDRVGLSTSLLAHCIIGVDPDRGWLALDRIVEAGTSMTFMRLSREAAETNLRAMLTRVTASMPQKAKGAVYFSGVRRGPPLFGSAEREFAIIGDSLPTVPVIGFFGAGEVCYNRIYSFTGVLAVFF
jgi:small ligand-binding sensory domain FIST